MAVKEFSLFGLYDISVKLPTDSAGSWVKIPYVNQAQYKGSVSEVDQLGDDARQDVFFHTQKGTLTVKASKVAMAVLEKLSGAPVSSGDTTNPLVTSGSTAEIIQFQTLDELTPPHLAVKATVKGRKSDGTAGYITAYWYKTLVHTAYESFPDVAYGKLDEPTFTFETFTSTLDENAATLANGVSSFGRIELL